MKSAEELVETCPAYGYSTDCAREEVEAWVRVIQADAYRAGQEATMKWVSEECKRVTERLTNATLERLAS